MLRHLLVLTAIAFIGISVFFSGQRLTNHWCTNRTSISTDDLEWLRLEFKLDETQLALIRQLHEGYVPKCRKFCASIEAKKAELKNLMSSGTNEISTIEQKLIEIGQLRARCQTSMIKHFREVSNKMPPEQGNRYLAEMQRLVFGFHEGIEQSMSSNSLPQHGHN